MLTNRIHSNLKPNRSLAPLLIACLAIAASFGRVAPLSGQEPFDCNGDVHIVQGEAVQLYKCDSSFDCTSVALPSDIEINNMGFRNTEGTGLLYAVELTTRQDDGWDGNNGIIQIDSSGNVFPLGSPLGLPTDVRFDAGDVSADGTTMYINRAGFSPLYTVDLTAMWPTATEVTIGGATGYVNDWAYNSVDGNLYGGDSTGAGGVGQLAMLDLSTLDLGHVTRTDFTVPGLPAGVGFGGAWFENTTGHLFLHQNDGFIYEIELAGPSIFDIHGGPGSSRNDGATCQPSCGPSITSCVPGTVIVSGGSVACDPPSPGQSAVQVVAASPALKSRGIDFLVIEDSQVGTISSRSVLFLAEEGAQVGSSSITTDTALGAADISCTMGANELLYNAQFSGGSVFADSACLQGAQPGPFTTSLTVNQDTASFSLQPDGALEIVPDSWTSFADQEELFVDTCAEALQEIASDELKEDICDIIDLADSVGRIIPNLHPAIRITKWVIKAASIGCKFF